MLDEPDEFQREQAERLYLAYCTRHELDPEDNQSALRFEDWFEDWNGEMGRE